MESELLCFKNLSDRSGALIFCYFKHVGSERILIFYLKFQWGRAELGLSCFSKISDRNGVSIFRNRGLSERSALRYNCVFGQNLTNLIVRTNFSVNFRYFINVVQCLNFLRCLNQKLGSLGMDSGVTLVNTSGIVKGSKYSKISV